MLAFSPLIALALALLAIGRGSASGQFLEVERKRDRYARYVCLALGTILLVFCATHLIF
jgi:hypothetical protein